MSNYRIDDYANRFKALSNPHRLALFNRLMSCCAPGTLCSANQVTRYSVGDLGQGLDIAASTLSHHLKELHRAGLIRMERQGKTIQCWVDAGVLDELADFFNGPAADLEHPLQTADVRE